MAARDATVAARDAKLAAYEVTIAERNVTIAAHDATMAAHEATIVARYATIAARDAMIAELQRRLAVDVIDVEDGSVERVLQVADASAGAGASAGGGAAAASGIQLIHEQSGALRQVKQEKAGAEQQVSALTGGLGYDAHQRLARAAQGRAEAEREDKGECDTCFLEGGEHEDWCGNK